MPSVVKKTLGGLASLKLTVALFAMGIFIVLAGTVAQIDKGIWTVVHEYFRCYIARIDLKIFFPRAWDVPGYFYFPGGWLIGAALMINIVSAHAARFKPNARGPRLGLGLLFLAGGSLLTWLIIIGVFTKEIAATEGDAFWRVLVRLAQGGGAAVLLLIGCGLVFRKRAGIVLLHGGVILLLVHEVFTGMAATEGQMRIEAGEYVNFTYDSRSVEFAIIDREHPEFDDTVVVPGSILARVGSIKDKLLPFDIEVLEFMKNSSFANVAEAAHGWVNPATVGNGLVAMSVERPEVSGVDPTQTVNVPAAYLKLTGRDGRNLGTYLAHLAIPSLPKQTISIGGKTYDLDLRFTRTYKPYSIQLLEFRHDKYIGTDTPKNFSARVRLIDKNRNVDRVVKIWMNNPLRYAGETFYQSSFEPGENLTILQVVRNDGWMLPYLSCMIVGTGLATHFGMNLIGFLRRRKAE